jgi:23S rRNA (adenine-N6)-dimethyltransferase
MPTYRGGRHEHGQNFLIDHTTIDKLTALAARSEGPIVEIGPGRGALTRSLQRLGRPVTAVEIDPRAVAFLRETLSPRVVVVRADFLTWRLPTTDHVIVGNVPFHLTTAILRKLLHTPTWSEAVLLVQWEVARRRAAVGGASMMTAQWWPWVEFSLGGRVPRDALRPMPGVDGGLLVMTRRPRPLVGRADRHAYRQFVHDVFTSRGRGVAAILTTVTRARARHVGRWLERADASPAALPKDLSADQWISLFRQVRAHRDCYLRVDETPAARSLRPRG